jgi:hypothetical protein
LHFNYRNAGQKVNHAKVALRHFVGKMSFRFSTQVKSFNSPFSVLEGKM